MLWPPRMAFIAATAVVLTFGYHLLLQGVQSVSSGSAFAGLSVADLVIISLLNGALAAISVPVVRALDLIGRSTGWLLGDTPDDLRAAHAAGVLPIGMIATGDESTTMATALENAGAAEIVDQPSRIEEIVP